MQTQETDARIEIDDMLKRSGWDIKDKHQVKTEVAVKGGLADYVLQDSKGRPIAVVEAKKFAIDPYVAKAQARRYAEELNVDFIFLSNGEVTYFWEHNSSDARIVKKFFTQKDLERLTVLKKEQKTLSLKNIPINKSIASGQGRNYQKECLSKIDEALNFGKRKILVEMATGSGKTRTAIAQIERMFKANKIEKVLFLVDRVELAKQAKAAFESFLGEDHGSYILKAGAKREEEDITISTLQTMVGLYDEFSPGYFDLIVVDECHRSIYGKWKYVLTYFDAIQIGLTATPSDIIDRSTYDFFKCKKPVFTYGIRKAIDENFLCGYRIHRALTNISLEGVTYKGEDYSPMQLERKINIPDRNRKMVQEFKKNAIEGKTIVFAVTKRHASELARFFNETYPEHNGKYAEIITSDIEDPDQAINRFKTERFPMIAVSVGMLDTGFDCPEVINLVMARPTRSPILYQQMRGRGTRSEATCKYKEWLPEGKKKLFTVFDFAGNTIFFNDDDYDPHNHGGTWGGVSPLTKGRPKNLYEEMKPSRSELIVAEDVEDRFVIREKIEVGPEGEKVDVRDYKEEFESKISKLVKANETLQKIKRGELVSDKDLGNMGRMLNRPRFFFNEENLRDAYGQPTGELIDFIKHALGFYKFPTREDRIKSNFDAFVTQHNFSPEKVKILNVWKNKFLVSKSADVSDFNHYPPLRQLGGLTKAQQLFGDELLNVVDELKRGVLVG